MENTMFAPFVVGGGKVSTGTVGNGQSNQESGGQSTGGQFGITAGLNFSGIPLGGKLLDLSQMRMVAFNENQMLLLI